MDMLFGSGRDGFPDAPHGGGGGTTPKSRFIKFKEVLELIPDAIATIPAMSGKQATEAMCIQGYDFSCEVRGLPNVLEFLGDEDEIEEHSFTSPQILHLREQQGEGENGPLLTDGRANYFLFCFTGNEPISVVSVSRNSQYGRWDAVEVPGPLHKFEEGERLFLRQKARE